MRSLPKRFITKVEVLEYLPNFDSMKVEEIVDKNGGDKGSSKGKERKESKSLGPQCYECMGFGHIAQDCANKQKNKSYNVRTWDDSDSDEEENCGGNSIVMALGAYVHPHVSKFKLEDESVNGEDLINSESEEEESLEKAFNELYIESLRLTKTNIKLSSEVKNSDESYVKLKQELLEAQARVSQVENNRGSLVNELVEIKNMNVKLGIDLHASFESNKLLELKVANLQVELDKANAIFKRMNAGTEGVEEILDVQRPTSNKTRIGFYEASSSKQFEGTVNAVQPKEVTKKSQIINIAKNSAEKPHDMKKPNTPKFIPTCHFCGVKGHIRPNCFQLHGYPDTLLQYQHVSKNGGKYHRFGYGFDRTQWLRHRMTSHEKNMYVNPNHLYKTIEKAEKVKTRYIWMRKSNLRLYTNFINAIDDIGSSGDVDFAF
ncbi:hypothetical protein RHGRI_018024 [Rhododendron griersonianum]|uniref:CCHC-type domain-containing protein n=1 Tax=Rhododendron griersonianum TaxID=479676 RepID=A0AAV6K034_9ERIC|nr:hypothetical protein RHGRI_018024 [Rhododendron griersonianum]